VKALPWLLVAILIAVVMWDYSHPRTVTIPGPTPSTASVRDSARASADSHRVRVDSLVVELRTAKAATIAAVLRERARRPAILGTDTVWLFAPDTTTDSAILSRGELAGLEAHHAVDSALVDSLRWDAAIQTVRADSLANRLGVCLADRSSVVTAYGRGFLHGAAAGATICIVTKTVL
jgi:hypothetical protein